MRWIDSEGGVREDVRESDHLLYHRHIPFLLHRCEHPGILRCAHFDCCCSWIVTLDTSLRFLAEENVSLDDHGGARLLLLRQNLGQV